MYLLNGIEYNSYYFIRHLDIITEVQNSHNANTSKQNIISGMRFIKYLDHSK
jgi:hypothetical protein